MGAPEGCSTSEIRAVLDRLFETKKSRLSFSSNVEMINQIFGFGNLGDILESLEAMGYQAGEETQVLRFARDSLARMKGFSPTSLALTFHHPLPPSLALKQDGEAAWALALGMQESEYQMAKQGKVS